MTFIAIGEPRAERPRMWTEGGLLLAIAQMQPGEILSDDVTTDPDTGLPIAAPMPAAGMPIPSGDE